MKNKIYVGNLSYDTTQDQLQAHFEQYGSVEDARLIMDRDTGRSKGFAFITFSSDEVANQAVQSSQALELDGRQIRVNIAEDKPRR